MTKIQRDRMIERYIDRTMTPSQEKEFLLLLDRDPELRRMLDAEQVVRTALLHDRDALPTTNAESRAEFIAFIGTALQKSAELAAPSALAASHGATIFSAGAIKATLAALITCALITGVYLFSSSSSSSFAPSATLRAPSSRPTVKSNALPALPPSEPAPTPTVRVRTPKNRATSPQTPSSQIESPRVDTDHESPAASPSLAPEVTNPPQTISSDTMRLNVKLNLEKLNREE